MLSVSTIDWRPHAALRSAALRNRELAIALLHEPSPVAGSAASAAALIAGDFVASAKREMEQIFDLVNIEVAQEGLIKFGYKIPRRLQVREIKANLFPETRILR